MLVNIYGDESRQTGHRYMVLGGIWLQADKELEFNERCHKFRAQKTQLLTAFLKWEKATSKSYLDYYKQFVDVFFEFKEIRFNCIIVDTHKIDYTKYHANDRELAFYKFYFFLLSRNVNPENKYLVLLDRRNNKKRERLKDLKERVNNYFISRGRTDEDVVKNIEARDSRLFNTLQLADIFIGSVGYEKEGFSTSPAKVELSNHIKRKRLAQVAKLRAWKFNVWAWQPNL